MNRSEASNRGGRPRDPAKRIKILTATTDLLSVAGSGGVTVEAIAAAAGVSKVTVYAQFPNRKELLRGSILHFIEQIEAMSCGSFTSSNYRGLRETLIDHGVVTLHRMTILLSLKALGLIGLMRQRYPDLASRLYEAGLGRSHRELTMLLSSAISCDLVIDDAASAAERLIATWYGLAPYRLLFVMDDDLLSIDRGCLADAVDRFMGGCAKINSGPA